MTPIHCLVADDHPAIVGFLREYLESEGIEVTGTASDGDEALAKIERQHPEVAIVDLHMPGLDGIEIARRAHKLSPGTAVIAYTGYGDDSTVVEALDAGARGVVQKNSPLADVRRAVETVVAGGVYVDPVLGGTLAAAKAAPQLTQRERDILRLLAEGCSNEEAASRLHISAATVRTHLANAMRKLDAQTRTAAVARAIREGLIS